jgi:arylamine N-acetyltransferase
MISALYNDDVVRKARAIAEEAKTLPKDQRDGYCQERCGLTYSYLSRVGKDFKKPSARVLMNLGYEVFVKDLATGEMSRLELDVKCDWNPSNPRMSPNSTPVFVNIPLEISSTSV